MIIKIHQINVGRDKNGVIFQPFNKLSEMQNTSAVDTSIYDEVFNGEVDANDLNDIFRMFNIDIPDGFQGHSLSVSDIIEVTKSKTVEKGAYYVDSIGFQKVVFGA